MPNRTVRVVAAGSFASGASEAGLAQGLREQGWLVEEVDSARHFGARTLAERLERRLRAPQMRARFNADIIDACDRFAPAVFLTVKGAGIGRDTLGQLRRRGVLTVNYFPDYHFNDVPLETLGAYELVVTTKSFQLDYLREALGAERVGFVHHGFSPLVHRPVRRAGAPYDCDIAYVGNASAYKAAMLTPLVEALPSAAIRIYGAGWDAYRATPLARAIVGRRVGPDAMADVIGQARINVACHMGRTESAEREDLVSTRTFEIPACGGFMLHIDNSEVRSLFDVPGEIDLFADAADLVAKCRYYLEHEAEREAIAARGHSRAVAGHSYSHRAAELASLIEAALERTTP